MTKNIPDKIISFINKTTDLDQIKKIKSNAQEKSNLDLVKICNLRIYKLSGHNYEDPFTKRFYECLGAYEEFLSEKNNKKTRANRTHNKLGKNPNNEKIKETIIDIVSKKTTQQGFNLLIEEGAKDFTFEALVIEFGDQFPSEIRKLCEEKLNNY